MRQDEEGVRDAGIGRRVVGIFGDRFLVVPESFPTSLRGLLVGPVAALQVGVVGFGIDSVNLN